MTITATNGKQYTLRFQGQNLEIERDEETTGLRRVFVFQDLSIGNVDSGRKESIFYSYDIMPTGERINRKRRNFTDTPEEFETFLSSDAWKQLQDAIIVDFLRKIEATSIVTDEG